MSSSPLISAVHVRVRCITHWTPVAVSATWFTSGIAPYNAVPYIQCTVCRTLCRTLNNRICLDRLVGSLRCVLFCCGARVAAASRFRVSFLQPWLV